MTDCLLRSPTCGVKGEPGNAFQPRRGSAPAPAWGYEPPRLPCLAFGIAPCTVVVYRGARKSLMAVKEHIPAKTKNAARSHALL